MTSVTKNPHPQPKNLVQSTRLADPFEPLNSSLAQSAEELGRSVRQPKTAVFFAKIAKTTQTPES